MTKHESALPPRSLGTAFSSRAPERVRAAVMIDAAKHEIAENNRVVAAVQSGHRFYDPGLVPADDKLYEGTGIGALFGLVGSERHLWQLAGWTLPACALDVDV